MELLLSQHRRQHDQPGHDLAKPASCGPRPGQERAKDQAKAEECACCVCGGPASFMCSGCKGSHYCSTECQVSCRQCDIVITTTMTSSLQRSHWLIHSKSCGKK